MFSPTQFGLLCLSPHAFFVAKVPLSWIAGEVNVSTSAARATGVAKRDATANPPAVSKTVILGFTAFLPLVRNLGGRHYSAATVAANRAGLPRPTRAIGPGHHLSSHLDRWNALPLFRPTPPGIYERRPFPAPLFRLFYQVEIRYS
jgi:hypothetical protein